MGRSKRGRATTGPFKRTRARRRAAFPPPRHDDKRIRFLMSNDHDNPTDSGPSDSDPVEAAPARSGRKRAADTAYGAESIKGLPGLEAVRKRPGMYIGDTDAVSDLHPLVSARGDNATHDALAGSRGSAPGTLYADGAGARWGTRRGMPV